MAKDNEPKHDSPMMFLIVLFTLFMMGLVMCLSMHEQISNGMRWVRVGQLKFIVMIDPQYRLILEQLRAIPANQIRLQQLGIATETVNGYFKFPMVMLMLVMAVLSFSKKSKHPFTRKLNLEKLITEQANAFSVTSPATLFNPLADNVRMTGAPVPDKLPPFAEALTPDEWVTYANIPVTEGVIDEETARRAFAMQLGGRWKGAKALPLYAQALFVAFSMKANGQRGESDVFLGEVAKCWNPKKGLVLTPALKKKVRQMLNDPKFGRVTEKVAAQHAFVIPALLRCLNLGREQGGVLAPAQFLWLRAVNRTMWYPLNNLGRGSVHTESAGAIAHYRAEKIAGKPIPNPLVDPAIEGLKNYLAENYITQFPAKEFARNRA